MQRRIASLSESEFWSGNTVWVLGFLFFLFFFFFWSVDKRLMFLGFLLQRKADLCVWRNREESVVWATMNFDLRSVCLKEQQRIGGLSGSEFWSAKPIWVLGFLLQLKADLCVWRNREESVVWASMNFDRERRFGF